MYSNTIDGTFGHLAFILGGIASFSEALVLLKFVGYKRVVSQGPPGGGYKAGGGTVSKAGGVELQAKNQENMKKERDADASI